MKDGPVYIILGLIVLVGVYLILTEGDFLKPSLQSEQGDTIVFNQLVEDRIGLDEFYTQNYPVYIESRSTNCESAGGIWVASNDRIGCYSIPIWDTTLCGSTELQLLKYSCTQLEAIFTCNDNQVGCAR